MNLSWVSFYFSSSSATELFFLSADEPFPTPTSDATTQTTEMTDSDEILTEALQNDDCFREEVCLSICIYLVYYYKFTLQLASILNDREVVPITSSSKPETQDFDAFIQQKMNEELQDQSSTSEPEEQVYLCKKKTQKKK